MKPTTKTDPKADPNSRRDLPTPDHIAAKENAEFPPDDETMSDQPGAYRLLPKAEQGQGEVDTETMSDQPGAKP